MLARVHLVTVRHVEPILFLELYHTRNLYYDYDLCFVSLQMHHGQYIT